MTTPQPTNTQLKGLKRNTIDKYYTKESIVDLCLAQIRQIVDISPEDLIIEPSAGNGAFIPGLKAFNTQYRFYDLTPEHPEIIAQDYLLLNMAEFVRTPYATQTRRSSEGVRGITGDGLFSRNGNPLRENS
jgi:hypothetical protein